MEKVVSALHHTSAAPGFLLLSPGHASLQRRSLGRERRRRPVRAAEPEREPRSAAESRVERFGRRGTEPFEPFEFFQNRNFP